MLYDGPSQQPQSLARPVDGIEKHNLNSVFGHSEESSCDEGESDSGEMIIGALHTFMSVVVSDSGIQFFHSVISGLERAFQTLTKCSPHSMVIIELSGFYKLLEIKVGPNICGYYYAMSW